MDAAYPRYFSLIRCQIPDPHGLLKQSYLYILSLIPHF